MQEIAQFYTDFCRADPYLSDDISKKPQPESDYHRANIVQNLGHWTATVNQSRAKDRGEVLLPWAKSAKNSRNFNGLKKCPDISRSLLLRFTFHVLNLLLW